MWDKKLLEYLRSILIYAKNNEVDLKKLYDELYWLQYSFCEDELEDKWDISHNVQQIFFEFQRNLTPDDLIKKIDKLMKK